MADQTQQGNPAEGQTAQISGTVQIQPQGNGQGAQGAPQQAAPKPEEPPAKKGNRRLIALVVVVLLVIIAGFLYWRSTFTEDTDDAQVDGDLYQVSSRVAGQVTQVYVQDNEPVKAGQAIAEVDPRDFNVAVEQAKANLANAKAEYAQATANVPITSVTVRTNISTSSSDVLGSQAGVLQAQSNVAAAQARVDQARANAIKAQADVDRYTPLVAKDVISKQQYDAAVAQAVASQAAVNEAEKSVKAQQDQVSLAQQRVIASQETARQNRQNASKQVDVQQARAQAAYANVQQAQAKLDQMQLNLGYTHIVAPIDGIVSRKSVAVGENLSVGQDLLTIVPLQNLWVTANFKETQLKQMHEGQEVDLKVDALGGRHFKGVLKQIGGATGSRLSLFPPENATGNYVKVVQRIPVRINFTNLDQENKDEALRPGMSVTPYVKVKN